MKDFIPNPILTAFREQRFIATDDNLNKYSCRFLNKRVYVKLPIGKTFGTITNIMKSGGYPRHVMALLIDDSGITRSILGMRKIVLVEEPQEA
ncbi:MAG: hypothetical protein ABIM99_02375 [Candidatus Dojkabacteria bacterium]